MAEKKKVSLKLVVDREGKKVLFAETSKEFVDFLFHIMKLPMGTIIKVLTAKDMAGCLGALYKSIESLNGDYLQEGVDRDTILNPRPVVSVPLLSITDDAPNTKQLYKCSYNSSHSQVTDDPATLCPTCYNKMTLKITYVSSKGSVSTSTSSNGRSGYVKGVLTYMVMDNLEFKPMSTISAISILKKFRIKDVTSLIEKEVQVGLEEGIAILKASLETQDVLTTVFFGKKIYGFEST